VKRRFGSATKAGKRWVFGLCLIPLVEHVHERGPLGERGKGIGFMDSWCAMGTENKRARASERPLPLNPRRLTGSYFFLPADFLLLVLDLFCLGFVGLLAMMFLVF
jgi:hypothetical protein